MGRAPTEGGAMAGPPSPLDFLDLDRQLSEEERLIRDTTRAFVSYRVLPEGAGWFERGEFPRELAKELGGLGLLGMHLQGDGRDWVLSGTKMWITNGSIADLAVVWARTEEGVRGFLVPRDTPGFSTRDIHRKLSL